MAGRGEERIHEGSFWLQRAPLPLLTISGYCQGTFQTPLKHLQHVGHRDWAGGEIHTAFEVWILEHSWNYRAVMQRNVWGCNWDLDPRMKGAMYIQKVLLLLPLLLLLLLPLLLL